MAELEKAYYSGESYRMAFVRSKISTILVNVYKMIRNIHEMSDGKYGELEKIFEKISNDLDQIVARKHTFRQGPFVLAIHDVRKKDKSQVGEKMANLGEISALPGIKVPQGFAITASATRHFLTEDAYRRNQPAPAESRSGRTRRSLQDLRGNAEDRYGGLSAR